MEDRSQSMTLPIGEASRSSDADLFKSRPMRLTSDGFKSAQRPHTMVGRRHGPDVNGRESGE